MASGVTQTGLREYKRALSALPAVVRMHQEAAARRAASRLLVLTRGSASARDWRLASEIVLDHRPSEQRFVVSVQPRPPRPANLPIWLEFGTRRMVARPFWYQHVNQVRASYPAEVDRALQAAYDATVNR